jgi:soluble lytic murein transglycosylase
VTPTGTQPRAAALDERARSTAKAAPASGDRGRCPARSGKRRRRLGAALAVALLGGIGAGVVVAVGSIDEAVREVTLPLRHDDIIRQQARDKDLDPALIAAIIYQESRFRPRTSPAGAEGLMQITPQTADEIAKLSGATRFELRDLDDPQVNIAYGAFYLRRLIERYGGNRVAAIAAYNAGPEHVNRWIARASGIEQFGVDQIGFPETRRYVEGVQERGEQYRENYGRELGLDR